MNFARWMYRQALAERIKTASFPGNKARVTVKQNIITNIGPFGVGTFIGVMLRTMIIQFFRPLVIEQRISHLFDRQDGYRQHQY